MKNYIVIAPWAGYTDMGSVNFVNAISDNTTEWEAERLLTALSGLVIICPDEETAEREVTRGREGLTNEAHAALMAAADATGNPRFDWRSGIPGEQGDEESGSDGGETDQETPDGENPTSPDADGGETDQETPDGENPTSPDADGGETDQETPDGENPTSPDADGGPSDGDGGGLDPDENDPAESSTEDDEDEEDEG